VRLAKQHLNVWLVVDHENERVHVRSPDLIGDALARGRMIRNSLLTKGIDPDVIERSMMAS